MCDIVPSLDTSLLIKMGAYFDFVSIVHSYLPPKETLITSFVLIFSAARPLHTSACHCFAIP